MSPFCRKSKKKTKTEVGVNQFFRSNNKKPKINMDSKNKIILFLQNQLSENEEIQFLDWVNENPDNKKEFFLQKDIWDSYRMQSERNFLNLKKEWNVFNNRLDILNHKNTFSIRQKWTSWMRIAAMLIVVFGLGWGANLISDSIFSTPEVVHQLEVPKGQRSRLLLADGSEVWLNSDSKINFSVNKNNKERLVDLEGEAFFHVARDEKHPFIVNVKGQSLKVLGTTFNVRAYRNEECVFTTLESGRVEVKAGDKIVELRPGQQLELNRFSSRLALRSVNTEYYTVWRDGRYLFENESFDDLIRMVERWYDVEFVYPKNFFEGMHYSGVIKRTKPIEHVLNLIDHTTPIEYEIKNDSIYIKPKR